MNQVPQIIVNQEGANLINKLLDVALKGGGLEALTLVKAVITVINTPPPQPVEKPKELADGEKPGTKPLETKKGK